MSCTVCRSLSMLTNSWTVICSSGHFRCEYNYSNLFIFTREHCMFNVYKNQLHVSRETGSRNLTGPKTLPTIWHTYMKLVTKYQISAINSCWEKCDEKWAYMCNVYKNQQSRQTGSRNLMGNYQWQKSDIWSQASYRYAILWVAFLNPSDSYFLFPDLHVVGFYTHWTYSAPSLNRHPTKSANRK
jgi:hypothetical protein